MHVTCCCRISSRTTVYCNLPLLRILIAASLALQSHLVTSSESKRERDGAFVGNSDTHELNLLVQAKKLPITVVATTATIAAFGTAVGSVLTAVAVLTSCVRIP
ncbi:hypothetical protein TcWFU_006243 [Taenia crassiceps]|uniref:Uncharacterized protein n=1 Tax=Taenia crassiceps TaxID=6207 RepID=A0ABR4Q994_9CEST